MQNAPGKNENSAPYIDLAWDPRVEILKNALKAIKEMNPANRDLADAQVMARRALRDAKIELEKARDA